MDAEAVALARADVGQVAVPAEGGDLGQLDPGLLARLVEQAELDPLGHLGEEREVGPGAVVGRAQGIGMSWDGFSSAREIRSRPASWHDSRNLPSHFGDPKAEPSDLRRARPGHLGTTKEELAYEKNHYARFCHGAFADGHAGEDQRRRPPCEVQCEQNYNQCQTICSQNPCIISCDTQYQNCLSSCPN